MKYYYTNAQNTPVGPVEWSELQRLLASGTITLNTHVIPEGSQQWVPLSSVREPSAEPSSAVVTGPTAGTPAPATSGTSAVSTTAVATPPHARSAHTGGRPDFTKAANLFPGLVTKFLNVVRGLATSAQIERLLGMLTTAAQALVLIGAALGLIAGVVVAIRTNTFSGFLGDLIAVVAVLLLLYVAAIFLASCRRLIATSPSRIASPAVLDTIGLFALLGGAGIFVTAAIAAIDGTPSALLFGLVGLFFYWVVALIALHPSLVNLTITDASAGEEAIGLLAFFAKLPLAILPLTVFVYALGGVIAIFFSLFGRSVEWFTPLVGFFPATFFSIFAQTGVSGSIGFTLLIFATVVPFFTYLAFLFFYLAIDLVRAIVSIPSKLDALKT